MPDEVDEYQPATQGSRKRTATRGVQLLWRMQGMHAGGKLRQSRERKRQGTYRHVLASACVAYISASRGGTPHGGESKETEQTSRLATGIVGEATVM